MAIGTPRSVSDATRFTAATPHASSKPFDPRFSQPSKSATKRAPGGGDNGPSFVETPEQRVARLRAAHRAAQAQASTIDKIIGRSRRVFDSAHKVFVMSIIGFTGVAFLVTAYTAADMISYNKKRKAEFIEAQKRMEEDSLEAARLAYMLGKATEEQVALVEEALEREAAAGAPAGGVFNRMPSALGAPKPIDSGVERVTEAVKWPASTPTPEDRDAAEKKSGLWAWMTSSLKKEEEGDDVMSNQRRLGYESLSEEDDSTGVRDSDLVRAVESKQALIREKAHEAFEKEKENQRTGGPLDRVGLDEEKPKKKGWLW
ncbi:cytochrome oxidase c assembly-domain-containing protein [Cercophora newfieldiana]|uniref:Cytochrome oxidase c assembly-domain-containing protein n=1 Tax=Cercophora newfieldiana TaxID=92897 RepID=A0AA40CMT4_9PEZI|nr:cytochrome oxidase c assembly-domain-containing protein [Cercophora newfieldiana]